MNSAVIPELTEVDAVSCIVLLTSVETEERAIDSFDDSVVVVPEAFDVDFADAVVNQETAGVADAVNELVVRADSVVDTFVLAHSSKEQNEDTM